MSRAPRNIGASVRTRLLGLAKDRGEDFQLLLTRYAHERFLYRLAQSAHRERFVLKGAVLFTVWIGAPHRTTRDVDLLGFGDSGVEPIRRAFSEVLAIDTRIPGGMASSLIPNHSWQCPSAMCRYMAACA